MVKRVILTICLFAAVMLAAATGTGKGSKTDYARLTRMSNTALLNYARNQLVSSQSDYGKALLAYTIITNRYNPSDKHDELVRYSIAFNNAGYIYFFYFYDYAKAYAAFQQAIRIARDADSQDNLSSAYLNMGNMYITTGSDLHSDTLAIRAINLYKQSFTSAIESKRWDNVITSFSNMTNLAFTLNKLGILKSEIQHFDALPVPVNIKMSAYSHHLSAAMNAILRHQYNKAITLLDLAERSINTPFTPERFQCNIIDSKAKLYDLLNDKPNEEKELMRGARIADSLHIRDLQVEYANLLFEFYKGIGDKALADKYHLLYIERKDSLATENNLQRVSEMQFLSEIHDIDQQLQQTREAKSRQNIIFWCVAIGSIALAIFIVVLYRKNRELESRNKSLYEKNLELLKTEDSGAVPQKAKYADSRLTDADKSSLAQKISNAFADVSAICSDSFSLNTLAESIGSKPKYVSQVINEIYGQTFSTLLSDARVKESCRRLNDIEHYGSYTIEAVAQSVGFKSRANFVTNFKRVTGLTPSVYQRLARENSTEK